MKGRRKKTRSDFCSLVICIAQVDTRQLTRKDNTGRQDEKQDVESHCNCFPPIEILDAVAAGARQQRRRGRRRCSAHIFGGGDAGVA